MLSHREEQRAIWKWQTFSSLWLDHILFFYDFIFIFISSTVIFIFNFLSVCFENTALRLYGVSIKQNSLEIERMWEGDNPSCVMLFMAVKDELTGDLFRDLDADHKMWRTKVQFTQFGNFIGFLNLFLFCDRMIGRCISSLWVSKNIT